MRTFVLLAFLLSFTASAVLAQGQSEDICISCLSSSGVENCLGNDGQPRAGGNTEVSFLLPMPRATQ